MQDSPQFVLLQLILQRLNSGLKPDDAMIDAHRMADFIETGRLPQELAERANIHTEDLPEEEDEEELSRVS